MTPLRPSLLPKIAACAKYEPESDAGPAADRGTRMDVVFRQWIQTPEMVGLDGLDDDDIAAVRWAVDTAIILAGGEALEANEENLRIEAEGMTGTADLLCAGKAWSADLKSGQLRNYREQQAAYALGFMDRFFEDEWTIYLLFCDERRVDRQNFTREDAEAIVRHTKARRVDPMAVANPCEYCDWCALRWKCPARLESVAWYLGQDPATVDFTAVADDPAKLAALLDLTHVIAKDDGLHDFLRGKAVAHVMNKRPVPGWRMQAGRETKTVPAMRIQEAVGGKSLLERAGTQAVFAAMGTLSAAKFSELWKKANGPESEPPADWINTNHGAAYLMKAKAKKEA